MANSGMAQLIELPTLGFCSGPVLMDHEIGPCAGFHAQQESAWMFSPSVPSPDHALSLK